MTVRITWADDIHTVPAEEVEAEKASRLAALNLLVTLAREKHLGSIPGVNGKAALVFDPSGKLGWSSTAEPEALDKALSALGFQLYEVVPETEVK
jgi:hypothetical protein